MTYNILDGGRGRADAMRAVLDAAQADIVLLQEVAEAEVVTRLAAALGYAGFVAEANQPRHKIALLSRLPVLHHAAAHPFPLRSTLLEARLVLPTGAPLHIFGVHLVAPSHVELFERWRILELGVILRRATVAPNELCLLAGDFNAIAPGDRVDLAPLPGWLRAAIRLQGGRASTGAIASLCAAGWHDVYRELHPDDDGFTLPSVCPNARLDYVFVNDALRGRLTACDVLDAPEAVRSASDHLPVIAEFAL
ncbi:MAG: endonuclease/exonuclease/phosphatase family protein [Chloroflexi bacterium]|nr:endonuclease/exonuclease/phosphatase family protein [Chloroflexota bacterium]